MKNEHVEKNVFRGSLQCSAFQFQLIAQFIFQKVRNQEGIWETKDYSFTVDNRANERQERFFFFLKWPLFAFILWIHFVHSWEKASSMLFDWCCCLPSLHGEDGAISATPYWICTEQAPSATRYNLWQHVEINSGYADWLPTSCIKAASVQHNLLLSVLRF